MVLLIYAFEKKIGTREIIYHLYRNSLPIKAKKKHNNKENEKKKQPRDTNQNEIVM